MTRSVVLRWTPEFSDLMDAFEARRYALGYRRRAMMLAWLCLLVAAVFMLYTLIAPAISTTFSPGWARLYEIRASSPDSRT